MKTESQKIILTCELCGQKYQMGPHKYDGKYIPRYKLGVCKTCYQNNWDGWAQHCEEKILTHLKEKGIDVPQRNEQGLLPRD